MIKIEIMHKDINEEIISAFLKSNTLSTKSISGLVQINHGKDKKDNDLHERKLKLMIINPLIVPITIQ